MMRTLRPFGVGALVFLLVAGLTVGLPPVVALAEPGAGGQAEPSVPTSALPRADQPVSLPAAASVPAPPVWPSAGSATAQLSRGQVTTSLLTGESVVADKVVAGGLPVTVAVASRLTVEQVEQRLMRGQKVPDAASTLVDSVVVRVLDQAAASGLGVRGVALTVAASSAGRVELTVDYSMFAQAFGGDFGGRLRVVSLPGCALFTPQLASCRVQTPVAGGRNDLAVATVAAPVDLAASSSQAHPMSASASPGEQVFAVTAGASSEQGNWGATNLSQAASWQAGGSGGSFTYSIPVSVPPAPGGLAPKISFDYSSASVDGLTKSTTSQTSWLGEGWSYDPGFVERSYRSCNHDGSLTPDLCWVDESPVSVVLNGVSSRLFKNHVDGAWKAEDDTAGWKVERLTGLSNGARDGEAFKITTRDGTQYLFGSKPAASFGGVLNVWLYGNNFGEPCYDSRGFAYSGCMMPYRWNLDQVIDVHGNTMDYGYTIWTGTYGPNNGASGTVLYDISSTLYFIEYGANVNGGAPGAHHTARVEFVKAYRCLDVMALCEGHAEKWPDVPWDQYCQTWDTVCPISTPTFWTLYRLAAVSTYVWNGSSWGTAVDTTTLTHIFPGTPDEVPPLGFSDTSPALWLAYLTRPGMPQMTFSGNFKRNRVNWGCCNSGGQQVPPMNRIRLDDIRTGTGEKITVGYTGEDCAYNSLPTEDNNNRRCFPQHDSGPVSWWHKYVVTDIAEFDGYSSVGELWHYDYDFTGSSTQALWKFDQSWHNTLAERAWSRWAGYSTVYTTHGNPAGGPLQRTETLYYRGMNRDRTEALGWESRLGTLNDGWDSGVIDFAILAGTVRRSFTIDGAWGNWKTVVRHIPSVVGTGAYQVITANPDIEQERWRETQTLSGTVLNGPAYRWTEVRTTFDSTYGLPTKVEDLGDTSTAADDRCTLTSYTTADTTKWLVGLVSQSLTTNCAATPGTGDYLGGQQMFYDGSTTLGATPSYGNVTKTTALATVTAAPPAALDFTTQSTAVGYDEYGRAQDVFDAKGRKTTTGYTPAHGGPVTAMKVTGPMGAGWDVTTTVDPKRGLPTKVVDANGKMTQAEYDTDGRLAKVWNNNRANPSTTGITPDVEYGYSVGASNWVSTKTLGPDGLQILAYQIFDGRLRARQSQTPSATGTGRAITLNMFNGIGAVYSEGTWHDAASAPTSTLVGAADKDTKVHQMYVYDNLGRRTNDQRWTGNGTDSTMLWQTITGYDGDKTITLTPPAGGTATTTIKDARGQTVELRQHQGGTPAGAYSTTTYGYDRLGRLKTVTDAGSNSWTYSYDLLGRKTQSVDPDAGTSTSGFDEVGNLTSTTDNRGQSLYFEYDNLNRKTVQRADTKDTGPIQATWTYDSVAKGQLTSASRNAAGNTYTSAVGSYDDAYRPLSTTDTIPGFGTSGATLTYTVTNTYKPNGAIATQALPAVGGLPAETLTYAYKPGTGLADRLTSTAGGGTTYLDATNYLYDGLVSEATYGAATGNQVKATATYDQATRRPATSAFSTKTGGTWTNNRYQDSFGYDNAGNITSIAGTKDGTAEQEQCFTYDHLRRLTQAWTQLSGACTTPQRTGADPYWRTWPAGTGFDTIGNRTQQIDKNPITGDTTWNYAIGGTTTCGTTAKPHQLRRVTATATATREFCYDPTGNTTKRTTDTGVVQDLTWDKENHLESVKQAGTTIASYLYDPSGRRLIGTETNTGTTTATLYLPDGTELAKIGTTNPLGRRYYGTTAVRDAAGGGLKWTINTSQGSNSFQIDPTTNTISAPRRYLPYGEPRTTQPTGWTGTKSYIGGTKDTTGLTHLGAREYDPTLGRFISVDPVMDLADPKQWNAYGYAHGNPVTYSDPRGLVPCEDSEGTNCSFHPLPPPRPSPGNDDGGRDFGGNRQVDDCRATALDGCPLTKTENDQKAELDAILAQFGSEPRVCFLGLCEDVNNVSQWELAVCHKVDALICKAMYEAAERTSLIVGFAPEDGPFDPAWNARHHAIWMALMVASGIDPDHARLIGLAHEIGAPTVSDAPAFGSIDSRKDVRNNEVGILVGKRFTMQDNGYLPPYDGLPVRAIVARIDFMIANGGCLDGVCLAL